MLGVPCLPRGSLAPAAVAGGGRAAGFLLGASPAAAASADLALAADTAARTAAAPGALCFLFLPPMSPPLGPMLPSFLSARVPELQQRAAGKRFTIPRGPAPPAPASSLHPGSSPLPPAMPLFPYWSDETKTRLLSAH